MHERVGTLIQLVHTHPVWGMSLSSSVMVYDNDL